jgi:hypothetical protein
VMRPKKTQRSAPRFFTRRSTIGFVENLIVRPER